jgi:chromosome segregation ATPase
MKPTVSSIITFSIGAVIAGVALVGCATPNKLIVDQQGGLVEVAGELGGTRIKISRDVEASHSVSQSSMPQPDDWTPKLNAARCELADLHSKLDAARRELAATVERRDQALEVRAKATAAAHQAEQAVATLKREIEQQGTASAAREKELADLTDRRDRVRAELTENQRAADALVAEIERLSTGKVAMELGLSAITLKAAKAEGALASASFEVAAREKRSAQLKWWNVAGATW